MKAIVCEMCNSTDVVKQDGMYVCQSCGTKYSVEEARKIMVEVDDSAKKVEKAENYYLIAENAYQSGNNKEAEEYCNKIIEIDPTHAKAWLLKGIAAAWQSTLANVRMDEFLSCVNNSFQHVTSVEEAIELRERAYRECYNLGIAVNKLRVDQLVSFPDNNKAVKYVSTFTEPMQWELNVILAVGKAFSKLNNTKPENERENHDQSTVKIDDLYDRLREEQINGGIKIWNKAYSDYCASNDGHPTDYALEQVMKEGSVAKILLGFASIAGTKEEDPSQCTDYGRANIIKACKALIDLESKWMGLQSHQVYFIGESKNYRVAKYVPYETQLECIGRIRKCHEKIKACDPTYEIPEIEEPKKSAGGCYVATAVYGSYDCPEVWTLRRYRDETLAATWYGRAFIRSYYAISPTLVRWFGRTEWFKNLWKPKLDRMVERLQEEGVESTPYQDREW